MEVSKLNNDECSSQSISTYLTADAFHLNVPVTHWGQQVFYLPKAIPLRGDAAIQIKGSMEMVRTKENARMYTVHFRLNELAANPIDLVYQIV